MSKTKINIIIELNNTFETNVKVTRTMGTKIVFANSKVRNPFMLFVYMHIQINGTEEIIDR